MGGRPTAGGPALSVAEGTPALSEERGDSRPRLSGGAELRIFASRKKTVELRSTWTAAGSRPYVGLGGAVSVV